MTVYGLRQTLEMICATQDSVKGSDSHLHELCVRLARGALFQSRVQMTADEIALVEKNFPRGHKLPAAPILKPSKERRLNG